MNLVSTILSMATPVVIDRIAAALGINSALARTAINFALPAILGSMASKAATPAGARDLMGAVQSADTGLFGNLESALGGSGKDALLSNGTSMLNKILGGSEVNALTSSLASKTGLGSGAAAMLLPLVGQMAVSGIAKAAPGLDASGLAKMLASQQGNLSSAAGTVSSAAKSTTSAAAPAAANYMKWLVPLAVAAAALWYFMGSSPKVVSDVAKPAAPAATTVATPASLTVDGVDISKTVTDSMGTLTTTLGTITNADTATAALPKITAVGTSLDGLSAVTSKLSADQKTMLGTLITAGMPALKAAADKVLGDSAIAAIAKPAIDGVMAKIQALAK
jgi:Bacterial protein of unknown function (DUF937)